MTNDAKPERESLELHFEARCKHGQDLIASGKYVGARQSSVEWVIAVNSSLVVLKGLPEDFLSKRLSKLEEAILELEKAEVNPRIRFTKQVQRNVSVLWIRLTKPVRNVSALIRSSIYRAKQRRFFNVPKTPNLEEKPPQKHSVGSTRLKASLGNTSQRKSLSEPPVAEDLLQASAADQGEFINPHNASAADSPRRVHFGVGGGASAQESLGRESSLFSSLKRSQSRGPLVRATGAPAIQYLIRNPERIDGLLKDAHAYVKASKGNWEVSMSAQSRGVYTAKFDETIIQMSRQHGANGLVQIMEVSVKCPVDTVSETKACEILMKMIPQLFDPGYKSVVTLKQDATIDQLAAKLEQSKQHLDLLESSPKTTRLD